MLAACASIGDRTVGNSGPSAARGPAAGLLARAPSPGRAKPRLAPAVGHDAAARLTSAMLLDAVAAVRDSRGWQPVLFAEPGTSSEQLAQWTGVEDARQQSAGGAGRRILGALQSLAADGYAPIAVVSADVPLLGARHLDEARAALREADVVFGPAAHGGYYLAAMWEPWPELFENRTLEWSGTSVLSSTESIAKARGMRTAMLPMERDIDRPADLEWLRARIAAIEERGDAPPEHTARLLRELESSVGA